MYQRRQKSHLPACISKLGTLLAIILVNSSFRASLVHALKDHPEDRGMSAGLKSQEYDERSSATGSPLNKPNEQRGHEYANEYDQDTPSISSAPCSTIKSPFPPDSPCLISSSSGDTFYTDTSDMDLEYDPLSQDNIDKRSFNAWGGKRSFNAWGGKRSNFNPWGGKRSASFNPWGGKRVAIPAAEYFRQLYPSQVDKRGFNAWGGKRQILTGLPSSTISRSSKDDYHYGRRLPFNPWGGR